MYIQFADPRGYRQIYWLHFLFRYTLLSRKPQCVPSERDGLSIEETRILNPLAAVSNDELVHSVHVVTKHS